jgi:hypothetical protein
MRVLDKRLEAEAAVLGVCAGDATAADAAAAPAAAGAVGEAHAGEDVRTRLPRHLYDFVHTDNTRPNWQKTSRDVWYAATLVHGAGKGHRRLGPQQLTSDAYGQGAQAAAVASGSPAHAKKGAWKEFYDNGHVEANGARF